MSENDKRSVTTDALATLGTIIGPNEKRDAIHLAVEPVIAGQRLRPGDHIGVTAGYAYLQEAGSKDALGIVDPFLTDDVKGGQRFWFIMYPRQVRSLRHVWSHPAFPDELPVQAAPLPDKAKSEMWLRDFSAIHHAAPSYDALLAAATGKKTGDEYEVGGTNDGKYLTIYGQDASGPIPPEMWDHIEIVTGLKNLPRATYFSCSC